MRTRTKLCGMMRPTDAADAARLGADAIGIILYAPGARRLIDLNTARQIIDAVPPYVSVVGVFVNAPTHELRAISTALGLSTVQMHGNETAADIADVAPLRVIKAVRLDFASAESTLGFWKTHVESGSIPNLVGLLLETPATSHAGGTGVANDFDLIQRLTEQNAFVGLPPIIVSGGLMPDNVRDVARRLRPYAVDVSSGIETSVGVKSIERMKSFIEQAVDV